MCKWISPREWFDGVLLVQEGGRRSMRVAVRRQVRMSHESSSDSGVGEGDKSLLSPWYG